MLAFALSFADYLLRRNLQHAIVHVTNHCNFRCNHCFVDFAPKQDMGLADFQRLATQIGRLFWLDLGGGEPFVRDDLAEIAASFDAAIVQIPTNGWYGDRIVEQVQRLQRLTTAELAVSISLDGLPPTHDRVRQKPGSWDRAWETFARLRRLGGVAVKINTVLHRENYGEMLDLMREVRDRGPDMHSIILLRGDPLNPAYGLPDFEDLRAFLPEMFAILQTYDYGRSPLAARVLRQYHKYLWQSSLATLERQTQVLPCQAGQSQAVFWADGRVSCCELRPAVGDLKHQTWADIRQSEAYRRDLEQIRAKQCHCTHNCAMFDSILLNPAQFGRMLLTP